MPETIDIAGTPHQLNPATGRYHRVDEPHRLAKPEAKRTKYGAVPSMYKGLRYDSKAEMRRAVELDALQAAGEIRGWTRQVPFWLPGPNEKYVADFVVWPNEGAAWAEDVKGVETPAFKKHKARWLDFGPCELRVIGKTKTEAVLPRALQELAKG